MSDDAAPPRVGLRVLAVDDEAPGARRARLPARARRPRSTEVQTAGDGAEALRMLEDTPVDALFVDIRMPGLDGLDLARVLRRFTAPPAVVFVSAYDQHALEAFDLRAVDYLMKPVREERLAEAVGRVARGARPRRPLAAAAGPEATTTRRSRSSSAGSPAS